MAASPSPAPGSGPRVVRGLPGPGPRAAALTAGAAQVRAVVSGQALGLVPALRRRVARRPRPPPASPSSGARVSLPAAPLLRRAGCGAAAGPGPLCSRHTVNVPLDLGAPLNCPAHDGCPSRPSDLVAAGTAQSSRHCGLPGTGSPRRNEISSVEKGFRDPSVWVEIHIGKRDFLMS
ncbi:PREDICTED: translation initiation factor IF-2-like [Ficedula albicollis]|uniref:translation initiation factor IF-2-like n=1 Tax=Ficedula albicollis TaxID=59894 RepID=UPI0003594334|nr:PREDICTED: translation initiation factor IF-2-like [Ficedula albicollis]